MRPIRTSTVCTLAVLAAACSASVTDPFRVVSDPIPTGLPASLRALSAAERNVRRPSVRAAGDSLVVVAIDAGGGCSLSSARAGLVDGRLVVTRFDSLPPRGLVCALIATGPSPFKVVVRPVPSGRYTVVVRQRIQRLAGAPEFRERELARASVVVP